MDIFVEIMETKRVQSLVVRLNNGNNIAIQESKTRAFLAEQSNKFSQLISKFKMTEKR